MLRDITEYAEEDGFFLGITPKSTKIDDDDDDDEDVEEEEERMYGRIPAAFQQPR